MIQTTSHSTPALMQVSAPLKMAFCPAVRIALLKSPYPAPRQVHSLHSWKLHPMIRISPRQVSPCVGPLPKMLPSTSAAAVVVVVAFSIARVHPQMAMPILALADLVVGGSMQKFKACSATVSLWFSGLQSLWVLQKNHRRFFEMLQQLYPCLQRP